MPAINQYRECSTKSTSARRLRGRLSRLSWLTVGQYSIQAVQQCTLQLVLRGCDERSLLADLRPKEADEGAADDDTITSFWTSYCVACAELL